MAKELRNRGGTGRLRSIEEYPERVSYLIDGPRRGMWLLGLFAGLALLLAAFGIYGVSS